MGKKESVRILVVAFIFGLALYFFLRRVWGVEGFYADAPTPSSNAAPAATGGGLQINKSTMTSKYGDFAKVVPKSEDYVKPYGMIFPAVEAQQICTTWGKEWGVPYSWKWGGSILGIRLYTPRVCSYMLGGTYVEIPPQFKQMMEAYPEKDTLPDGYGVCMKDIQLGSGFNNQLIKNGNLSEVCNYLNYTTPAF